MEESYQINNDSYIIDVGLNYETKQMTVGEAEAFFGVEFYNKLNIKIKQATMDNGDPKDGLYAVLKEYSAAMELLTASLKDLGKDLYNNRIKK